MKPLITSLCFLTVLTMGAFVETHAAQEKKESKFNYKETAEVQPLNRPPEAPLSLGYNHPSTHWEEALPVGTGRLGTGFLRPGWF